MNLEQEKLRERVAALEVKARVTYPPACTENWVRWVAQTLEVHKVKLALLGQPAPDVQTGTSTGEAAKEVTQVAKDFSLKTDAIREIEHVLNRACNENQSNTPDFILAEALASILNVLHRTISERDKWYGIAPCPGKSPAPLSPAQVEEVVRDFRNYATALSPETFIRSSVVDDYLSHRARRGEQKTSEASTETPEVYQNKENRMKTKIWFCKIGEVPDDGRLPSGCDSPMRNAVEEAYQKITGKPSMFCFSGWAGELTEPERAVVEDRDPDPALMPIDYRSRAVALTRAMRQFIDHHDARHGHCIHGCAAANATEAIRDFGVEEVEK